jgi:hypothetical protein
MAAVQIVDWLAARGKLRPRSKKQIEINFVAWLFGLIIYHAFISLNSPCGATLPSMFAAAIVAAIGAVGGGSLIWFGNDKSPPETMATTND